MNVLRLRLTRRCTHHSQQGCGTWSNADPVPVLRFWGKKCLKVMVWLEGVLTIVGRVVVLGAMQTLRLEVGQQGSHGAAVHALSLHQHEQLKQARNSMYPGYACMYWSADVPRVCMHVPVSKVYPEYACMYVPVSSVPRIYMYVQVSKCTQDMHVCTGQQMYPGYACMYLSAKCNQGIHVPVSKVYPGYTCMYQAVLLFKIHSKEWIM